MSKKQENKKETAKKQDVQKAGFGGVAGGMVIAGASAMVYDKVSGQEFAQFETPDGNVVGIWTDTDNNGIYDTEFIRATPIPEEEQEQIEEVVQAETVPVSEEGQTFSEAFADARTELGAGGVFEWIGQLYNTFYAEEWQDMDESQHNEWASLPTDDKLEYYDTLNDDDIEIGDDDNLIAEEQLDMDDDSDDNGIPDHLEEGDDMSDWEVV